LFAPWICRDSLSSYFLFVFRSADCLCNIDDTGRGTQEAYNSSQQELEALRDAALEACQSVEEGDRQAGSSVASRLWALGGHVARRIWGALRLGIQKTLRVVQLHYRVNLAALATGYIIADNLDVDGAEAEANRLDALAAPA
jgi:hypothetical protein